MDSEIKQYIDGAIKSSQKDARYGTSNASYHTHNGIDSPKLAAESVPTGVSRVIAGTNVTVSPVGGTGAVTVNASLSSAVSSVTGSGSGILVTPTTGAVVVSNTGVVQLVQGSNITLSGTTGTITISASGGGSIATLSGTDSLSGTTPTTTTHTITHGFGKRPTTITLSVPTIVAAAPAGTGTTGQEPQGWFTLDTNGNSIAGMYVSYTHVFGGGGTFTLSGGGLLTNSITGTQTTSGGTGTAVITLNNITTTTFDIVYAWTGSSGQGFNSPTVTWTVMG